MSDRNAFGAKLGRLPGLKYSDAYEAMLDRFQKVERGARCIIGCVGYGQIFRWKRLSDLLQVI